MRIDVRDLHQLWFEDQNGVRFVPDMTGNTSVRPSGFIHMHSQFVNRLSEEITTEVTAEAVAECEHPDIVDVYADAEQACRACGGRREIDDGSGEPGPWKSGHSRFTSASTYAWSPDLVMAMTRPTEEERELQRARWDRERPSIVLGTGEGNHQAPLTAPYLFGLEEAIIISARACERCMNALFWTYGVKFKQDDQGYPEMSASWRQTGVSCRFCRHLGHIHEPLGSDELTPTRGILPVDEDDNPF